MQGKAAAWPGRYLAHLRTERRLSPHTESAYRRDLEALVAYCDAEKIAGWKQLDNFHIRTFAAREHRDGLGPRSVQRRLSALRGFFNYLIREGVVDANPAADIRAPKAPRRLPKTLDVDQVASLLAHPATSPLQRRDHAILVGLAEIGTHRQTQHTLGKPLGQYSHMARVAGPGETLYIAGMLAPGDGFDAQCSGVFRQIETALKSAGAGWGSVAQFTTYLVHSQDIPKFMAWRLREFPQMFPDGKYPPNTLLVVNRLVKPEFLVEVEAIARVPG